VDAKITKKKAETALLAIGDECDVHKAQVFFSNSEVLVKTFVRDALHACGGLWSNVEHTKEAFRIGPNNNKSKYITRNQIFAEFESKNFHEMIEECKQIVCAL